MVICLELGADLHMAQLMPLPLTVSCFSKIQIGLTFLVPDHPGSPGKKAVKWVCVKWVCAFARDYGITGVRLSVCLSVCLFVCLSVTTITKYNVDGSGQNFGGRFLGGKASPSSFAVTTASRVWILLSKAP